MYLERFYDETLAQASWLLGCQATRQALLVDPNRDVEPYVRAAERQGLAITHVTETHIHADFLSGTREVAARTGAAVLLSGEGGPDWSYRFAEADGARLLHDGDVVEVGNLRVRALHTPGHTPEHLSFEVTDGAATDRPMGVFTGDFLFVGDVGRPDLLEKAAGVAGTMEAGARQLWSSLERFRAMPDHLQVWPGHGAGSACGKALGAVPQSTLGYEKLVGWAFAASDEATFVRQVLEDQPEPPRYFARMKTLNRDGPPLLDGGREPAHLPPGALDARGGALAIDVRLRDAADGAPVSGALSLPLDRAFTTWAGWLLPPDRDLLLLAPDAGAAREARRLLALIGLDRVAGWVDVEALLDGLRREGAAPPPVRSVTPSEAARLVEAGEATLLDVRSAAEWGGGRAPGARHLHLGDLPDRLDDVPRDGPVLVYCQSGARSAIARSLLQREGFTDVRDVDGGWIAWARARLPVETDAGVRRRAG